MVIIKLGKHVQGREVWRCASQKILRCSEVAFRGQSATEIFPLVLPLQFSAASFSQFVCLTSSISITKSSAVSVELNEFRCYEAKIKVSEKAGSCRESNLEHLCMA